VIEGRSAAGDERGWPRRRTRLDLGGGFLLGAAKLEAAMWKRAWRLLLHRRCREAGSLAVADADAAKRPRVRRRVLPVAITD
jgi:hypothetical protein